MNTIYRRLISRATSIWQAFDDITWNGVLGEEYRDAYVMDMYMDERGTYAIFASQGKLFRTYVTYENQALSYTSPEEVVIQHVPLESRTKIFRSSDGQLRFISIASAAVLNRVGEIDTVSLFDSMVASWDERTEKRNLNFYHIQDDDFAMGEVVGIERYSEFLIAYGTIDESTILGRSAEKKLSEEGWGLSIEFIPTSDYEVERIGEVNVRKFTEGIFVGLAVLREEHAASHFTNIVI